MAVANSDVEIAKELMDRAWREHLDEHAQEAAELVIDFREDSMTCPACLTAFATGPTECPECGLFLG